ncbi:class I adenylate-forming enzyme family protein [Oceanobacillus sp. CFH 90083]|uniref:class I adenylate-forming enzyme family protein n=1 Tax=Oceanobacillus sp. CFH 90083 TaxID=2592336 RepID=UPI00128C667F|nr:class I adenylate-forming enzyme family protein [Oceanobacillus sp. CFH 90083]
MKFIHDLLDYTVQNVSDKIAILTKTQKITYKELQEKSIQFSNLLQEKGVVKGDRVLLMVSNRIELAYSIIGISRVGGVAVVINTEIPPEKLNYIIGDCSPKLLIYETEEFELQNTIKLNKISLMYLKEIITDYASILNSSINLIDLKFNDIALIIYTSGSTGNPKGVISNHCSVLFCTKTISQVIKINQDDLIGNFLPLSFDYGLYQLFLTLYNKATLMLGNSDLSGVSLVRFLEKWEITIFPSMPHLTKALIKLLNRSKKELSLRLITSTGEYFPEKDIMDLQKILPHCEIYSMYGLTECKRVSILRPCELNHKSKSVGRPLPNVECHVIDKLGNKLKEGMVGQLVVKGPNVMNGYWGDTELTNEKFKSYSGNSRDTLFTGDLFKIDLDGYLYFIGRMNDIYKQNGYRISCKEIEDSVYEINLGDKAVLIPPDEHYRKSRLYVRSRHSSQFIKKKLKTVLERYKIPDEVIPITEFPITINGKIDKVKLKKIKEY